MGKQVKQMQLEAMRQTFQDVRDVVLLTVSGVDCQTDNHMRLALRMKSTRWEGPTLVAWGAGSLSELSRELDAIINFKKNDKIKPKVALSEGQEIEFAKALKMPTRAEAIARVISL